MLLNSAAGIQIITLNTGAVLGKARAFPAVSDG